MYDATMIKTYQPKLPTGKGPICENVTDALRDIINDIYDQMGAFKYSESDVDDLAQKFAPIVTDWVDGEYMIFFDDYKIVIKHYQRGYLDSLPEFAGY